MRVEWCLDGIKTGSRLVLNLGQRKVLTRCNRRRARRRCHRRETCSQSASAPDPADAAAVACVDALPLQLTLSVRAAVHHQASATQEVCFGS